MQETQSTRELLIRVLSNSNRNIIGKHKPAMILLQE